MIFLDRFFYPANNNIYKDIKKGHFSLRLEGNIIQDFIKNKTEEYENYFFSELKSELEKRLYCQDIELGQHLCLTDDKSCLMVDAPAVEQIISGEKIEIENAPGNFVNE